MYKALAFQGMRKSGETILSVEALAIAQQCTKQKSPSSGSVSELGLRAACLIRRILQKVSQTLLVLLPPNQERRATTEGWVGRPAASDFEAIIVRCSIDDVDIGDIAVAEGVEG